MMLLLFFKKIEWPLSEGLVAVLYGFFCVFKYIARKEETNVIILKEEWRNWYSFSELL